MFNTQHILYMVISAIVTAALLVLFNKKVTTDRRKDQVLRFFAIITVIIHISDAWVDYFVTAGTETITSVHILPIYPCNVIMWMLLIAALLENKKGTLFQMLGEYCFFAGILCGTVGILLNKNFDSTPTLADYSVLKGLVSHSTMLLGCIYLKTAGFIRFRSFNTVSIMAGMGVFLICGVSMDWLAEHFGMEAWDGMFLRENDYLPVSPLLLCAVPVLILHVVLALRKRKIAKANQ